MGDLDWEFIYSHWSTLQSILKSRLPTQSHQAINEHGVLEPSGRPMIEDIHECKVHKIPRLALYLKLMSMPLSIQRRGNEVYAKLGNKIELKQKGE